MQAFDYLSVFVSIIIALGVTHLLSSLARFIRLRDQVRAYSPVLIWVLSLLLLQVQIWWVSFYRRDIPNWTFFGFILYLLIPSIVSMLSHLVMPDLHAQSDMEREYFHNRKWFFGLLAAVVIISLAEDLLRSAAVRLDANFAFRVEFLVVAATGFFSAAKRAQLAIALIFLLSLIAYIALVFSRL